MGGRRVVFTADDFTFRAGHADGALMDKTVGPSIPKTPGLFGTALDSTEWLCFRFTWRNCPVTWSSR